MTYKKNQKIKLIKEEEEQKNAKFNFNNSNYPEVDLILHKSIANNTESKQKQSDLITAIKKKLIGDIKYFPTYNLLTGFLYESNMELGKEKFVDGTTDPNTTWGQYLSNKDEPTTFDKCQIENVKLDEVLKKCKSKKDSLVKLFDIGAEPEKAKFIDLFLAINEIYNEGKDNNWDGILFPSKAVREEIKKRKNVGKKESQNSQNLKKNEKEKDWQTLDESQKNARISESFKQSHSILFIEGIDDEAMKKITSDPVTSEDGFEYEKDGEYHLFLNNYPIKEKLKSTGLPVIMIQNYYKDNLAEDPDSDQTFKGNLIPLEHDDILSVNGSKTGFLKIGSDFIQNLSTFQFSITNKTPNSDFGDSSVDIIKRVLARKDKADKIVPMGVSSYPLDAYVYFIPVDSGDEQLNDVKHSRANLKKINGVSPDDTDNLIYGWIYIDEVVDEMFSGVYDLNTEKIYSFESEIYNQNNQDNQDNQDNQEKDKKPASNTSTESLEVVNQYRLFCERQTKDGSLKLSNIGYKKDIENLINTMSIDYDSKTSVTIEVGINPSNGTVIREEDNELHSVFAPLFDKLDNNIENIGKIKMFCYKKKLSDGSYTNFRYQIKLMPSPK